MPPDVPTRNQRLSLRDLSEPFLIGERFDPAGSAPDVPLRQRNVPKTPGPRQPPQTGEEPGPNVDEFENLTVGEFAERFGSVERARMAMTVMSQLRGLA